MQLFRAEVLDRRFVSAGMVRVRLGGEGLKGFKTTGVGDEYVRLFFPHANGEVVTPEEDERGFWKWPEGKTPSHCACYTVRAMQPDGTLDLDFVVHEHGIASEWAQTARPGDRITINAPRWICEAPAEAADFLFVADATGLPAIGRLLENLKPGQTVRAIVEVPSEAHKQDLTSPAELKLTWIVNTGNGVAPSRLEAALKAETLGEGCYVWAAAEQKAVRPIRKHLRHGLGWAATRYSVTSYWVDNLKEYERRWEAMPEATKKAIDDAWASDRDREVVEDEVEAVMEKHGL